VVLGQMRPNNRSTMINDDLVARRTTTSWPLVHLAFESGTRIIGEVNVEAIDDVIPVWCVPVRFDGRVVAVMVRLQDHFAVRRHSTNRPTSRSSSACA